MRTKALLLTAAVSAAGLTSLFAGDPVYSVNVVGFINLTCKPDYTLIANQLSGTNSQLATIVPTVPEGTQLLKWDADAQSYLIYSFIAGAWYDDNGNEVGTTATFGPGEGAFVYNAGTTDFTITLVGEVPQGTSSTDLKPNYTLVGSKVPVAGLLTSSSVLTFPTQDGMQVFKWLNGTGYLIYSFIGGAWYDDNGNEAVVDAAVGEGFFVYNNTVTTVPWTLTFNVN